MDLTTRDYSREARERLGDALTARRVEVSPAWANRAEFLRVTGLNKKLVERLELGQPANYRPSTQALVARAYQVTAASLRQVLDGTGGLVPEARPAVDDRPLIVQTAWSDEMVRRIWGMHLVDEHDRLMFIRAYLERYSQRAG